MAEKANQERFKITYLGMQAEGDKKRMAFVLAKLFGISPNEGIQRLKKPPFLLKEDMLEDQAEKFFKLLRKYGAVVSLESQKPEVLTPPQTFVSRSRIHSTFLLFLSFLVLTGALIWGGKFFFVEGEKAAKELSKKAKKEKSPYEVKNKNPEKGYLGAAASIIGNMKQKLGRKGWKDYGEKALEQEGGYLPKEDFEYAMRYIKAAEKEEEHKEEALRWKAALYALDGQKQKADQIFQEGLQRNPKDQKLREDYGGFLMDTENYSKADYQFRTILQGDPKNAGAHKNLGTIHSFYLKNEERGKEHYFEYLKVADKKDQERYLVAKELSGIAWKQQNGSPFPAKGEHLISFEQFEKQRGQLETLKKQSPENPALLEEEADLYAKRGFHQPALENLNKVIADHPNRPEAYMKKAEIQMALENPDQAYHTLKEAVKQEAVSEEVYENLGLMEKFYKADSTATRKVVEEYLKKGGRPSPQIRSLLQF